VGHRRGIALPLGWRITGLMRFGDEWIAFAEGPDEQQPMICRRRDMWKALSAGALRSGQDRAATLTSDAIGDDAGQASAGRCFRAPVDQRPH
jgi:hypothetical protein